MFASEDWITGDIEAVEFNKPTRLFIDCLEDSGGHSFEKKSCCRSKPNHICVVQ